MNTAGVIDEDYRGEWAAHLICKNRPDMSPLRVAVARGDRFLQCLILPVAKVTIDIVAREEFNGHATDRGEGGFGSTGR